MKIWKEKSNETFISFKKNENHNKGAAMKKSATIFLIFLLTGIIFPQEIKWYKGSLEEIKTEAKKQNKMILIVFSTKSG